jgi:hypothetical protein
MRSLRGQVYLLQSVKERCTVNSFVPLLLIALIGVVAWGLGYAAGRRTHKSQE